MSNWKIECEPDGKNDGINECGMVIYLTNGSQRKEVSAVGFIRRNAANPDASFEVQLDREIGKAKHALKVARELEELTAGERSMA